MVARVGRAGIRHTGIIDVECSGWAHAFVVDRIIEGAMILRLVGAWVANAWIKDAVTVLVEGRSVRTTAHSE